MSEHKQIERVFQEAFNGFEAKPNKQVWEEIQNELEEKERKKPIMFWLLSIGAIVVLGLLSYTISTVSSNNPSQLVNSAEHKEATTKLITYTDSKITFNIIPKYLNFSNNSQIVQVTNQTPFVFKLNKNLFNIVLQKDFSASEYTNYMNPNHSSHSNHKEVKTDETPQNSIAANEEKTVDPIASNITKWEFTPFINTTYFSSLKQGSPLDASLKDNKKEFETAQSFGFNIGRAIGGKWKLNTGLSILRLNYSTFNIAFKNDYSLNRFSGVNYTQYNSSTNVRDLDNSSIAWNEQEGSIKQEIEYLEFPLSVSYSIKNNKHLDLGITGGMSTLFLTNNRLNLYDTNSGAKTYFGKANNLSMINASANASLDFNYHISKRIHFNLSPSFKYYLEMFDQNSGDFKPYSVGISTGFKVKF